jgi:beta-glucosidase
MAIQFPKNFLWGTASAAYQVEGAVNEDGRGQSIWDVFSHTPGKTIRGDTGDIASDQYHRLDVDLDLIKDLGIQSYRFSVAWSRVQPDGKGKFNKKGFEYYHRLVDGLLERNIQPALTLYHWDLPQALQDYGGWTNRDTAYFFRDYVAEVYKELKDKNPIWMTLNEPWCSAFIGHLEGRFAPGIRDESAALKATHHLLLAHGEALRCMRSEHTPGNKIGIVLSLESIWPASNSEVDLAAARHVDGTENRLFLDPIFHGSYPQDMIAYYRPISDFSFVHDSDLDIISTPLDFLGVNYYLRHLVKADPNDPRGAIILPHKGTTSATGAEVVPEGLTELLLRVKNEYSDLPIYITENGTALYDYADPLGRIQDFERIEFLDAHLKAAYKAIEQGVDLRGYYLWTFVDNFEWAHGYSVRYGIIYVDYPTQKRTPKSSAYWYKKVIHCNGFE